MLDALDVRAMTRVAGRCPRTGQQLVGTYRGLCGLEGATVAGEAYVSAQRGEDLHYRVYLWCGDCRDYHAAERTLPSPQVALLG